MQELIALLEECLENGDQGQAVLFAWFLAERNGIISVIQQATEQAAGCDETPNWKLDPHIAMHRIVTKRQAASAAARRRARGSA